MDQNPLFTEDILQALDDVILARGTYQQVAGELWPSCKTAYNRLKNKLSPDHHEHFHIEEVLQLLRMGREMGVHTAMYFIADECGYERPGAAAPKSPLTKLRERDAELAAERARIQREIDRLEGAAELRAVKAR